jgi:exosome complex component RRP4
VNIRGERDVEVIPLSGIYRPRIGDVVIGYIVDIGLTGWVVDINSPYQAYLPVQEATLKPIDLTMVDLKSLLSIGDVILTRIIDFNLARDYPVTLTLKEARLGRIEGGTLVEIDASKVARVIGRRGSMVNIFNEELGCDVTVGQNGRIWIRCRDPSDEAFVARVIKFIEAESHTSGLTDRVRSMVSQYKSGKKVVKGSATPS